MANTFTKQVTASPAVSAKRAPQTANTILIERRRQLGRAQHRLQRQPFADESVERRQCCNRQDAYQEKSAGPRHAANDAAKAIEIAGAGSGFHGTRADEEQRLVHGMIGEMVQRRDQSNGADNLVPGRDENHRGADACGDDPHVLDGTVRKQSLHLALDGRVENADQRRKTADDQHDEPRTGPYRRRKIEIDSYDPIDPQIDDDCR